MSFLFHNIECINAFISYQNHGIPFYIKMIEENHIYNKNLIYDFFSRMTFNQLVKIIDYFNNNEIIDDKNIGDICAKFKHYEFIKWLYINTNIRCTKYALHFFIQYNSLDMVKWFYNNKSLHLPLPETFNNLYSSTKLASKFGHLDILKYLLENINKKPCRVLSNIAATQGHSHIVDYLYNNFNIICEPLSPIYVRWNGNKDSYKILKEQNVLISFSEYLKCIKDACKRNDLEYVKWIKNVYPSIKSSEAFNIAWSNKFYDIVNFMLENEMYESYYKSFPSFKNSITYKDVNIAKLLFNKDYDILTCLLLHSWENDNDLMEYVKFVWDKKKNCHSKFSITLYLLKSGNLEPFKWIYKKTKEYFIIENIISICVIYNRYNIMKYIVNKNNKSVTNEHITQCIVYNRFDMLKYLSKYYSFLNYDSIPYYEEKRIEFYLVKNENIEMIEWLINKITINYSYLFIYAIDSNKNELAKWIYKKSKLLLTPQILLRVLNQIDIDLLKFIYEKYKDYYDKHVFFINNNVLYIIPNNICLSLSNLNIKKQYEKYLILLRKRIERKIK